jgi:hypothetical protein
MENPKMIAISGNATSGKDSLCKIINKYFNSQRVALADELKKQLDNFCIETFNISSYTQLLNEKKIIRPILVETGRIKRIQSEGTYWTGLIQKYVLNLLERSILPVVTDIRYTTQISGYEEDEDFWVRKNNGILIYIERIDSDGKLIPSANQDEEVNNKILKENADIRIVWPTFPIEIDRENWFLNNLLNVLDRYFHEYRKQ